MRLFGTDGIRGKVNRAYMTPEMVLRVGSAAASVLSNDHGRNMVLIGKDTRISGYLIESSLTSGLCSMGMNVTLVGPIPTPGIAFLTRTLRLDAGIVISASHNPFEDNGIKIFSSSGLKISDDLEREIERLVEDESFPGKRPAGGRIGKAFRLDDATGRYLEYVKSTIPRRIDLEGLKVVVDTANGAAYRVTPGLLAELGADVVAINDKPDGTNINDRCGSLHMEGLIDEVRKTGSHVGIAHDGDADRTLFIDEKGQIVDGDMVMGICAVEMKREGSLRGGGVVATVMSNFGLERFLLSRGIRLVRTAVGDRYVVEEMIRGNYNLGGEQSGHIVFFDHNTTGDGPVTALQVLHVMRKRNMLLSELTSGITLYPQVLINVPLASRRNPMEVPAIRSVVDDVSVRLGTDGRVLVRPSGTEAKVRVMVEGIDRGVTEAAAQEIAAVITQSLGIQDR